MNKTEFDNTNEALEKIMSQTIESIELEEKDIPSIDALQNNNISYKFKCSILFIDIRQSTVLNDKTQPKNMIKIYKSFIRMTTQCVRYAGGVTRQFVGDRIMGVFIDDYDENHTIIRKSADKAIDAARNMCTYIDYLLNHLINKYINGKFIKCGIGICTGNILLAKVGMKGVENDNTKQNENGDIWVGKITNYASKYADLTNAREIFIDENTYKELSEENKKYLSKDIWHRDVRTKGNKTYCGYICKEIYVNNIQELNISKFEYEEDKINNNIGVLDEFIKIIGDYKLKEANLYQKEKELEIKEKKILDKEKNIDKIIKEKQYYLIYDIIHQALYQEIRIKEFGREYWLDLIDELMKKGKEIGKDNIYIISTLGLSLIEIYKEFELFEEAYDILVTYVKNSKYVPNDAIEIVKKVKRKAELLDSIKEGIESVSNTNEKIEMKDMLNKIENVIF